MLYDIYKSYSENVQAGPCFKDSLPSRSIPSQEQWKDFLGYKVASPIGVAAGPLLTSSWTTLASRLGFDIITYKTIRSYAYPGHEVPNILYIDAKGQLDEKEEVVISTPTPPLPSNIAITNSFGMPSQSPEFLEKDIDQAARQLQAGQILVVSVTGSYQKREFIQDFIDTALLAKRSGAPIIEANLSCPNVVSGEGSLYTNPQIVFDLSSQLVKALNSTPLIIKVGLFPSLSCMKGVFDQASRGGVRAISGINTIPKIVLNEKGEPALGKRRLTSGICGAPIRNKALKFIEQARQMIDKEKLPLTLIGVGGITRPEDFHTFLKRGADFAQTASGMMWDPYLALKFHQGN